MIFVKFDHFLEFLYTFFSWLRHKAAENVVIWPKADYFGYFYQEHYLLMIFCSYRIESSLNAIKKR
jgi:hypothetical protein